MSKETLISLLPSVFKPAQTQDMDLYTLIDKIMAGEWKSQIQKLRAMPKARYKKQKANILPAVTISGRFSEAKAEGLIQHSGFICIDIDDLDDQTESVFHQLTGDPYIHFLARSASGNGLFGFVRISNDPEKHKTTAKNLIKYFADTYNVILDEKCTDIPRKRFVSWDVKAYVNMNSKQFRRTAAPKPVPKITMAYSDSDISHIIKQITDRGLNLTEDYSDWYRLGWALIEGLPEGQAREYFHTLSSYSSKYDSDTCDRKFNQLLKDRPKDVTLGTFFHMAAQKGIELQQPQTKVIFRSAAFSKKNQVSQQAAIKKAKLFAPDADEKDIKQIVEQTYSSNADKMLEDDDTPIIIKIKEFILQNYKVRYNLVKGRCEVDGEMVNDLKSNSIYIAASQALGDQVRKSDIEAILNSEDIECYHPIRHYFDPLLHHRPEGVIAQLADCLETPTGSSYNPSDDFGILLNGERYFPKDSYKVHFLKKYAVSMMESAYKGTPPRFQLVLTGKQYSGKTSFFREMLPEKLRSKYYAEANMDSKDIGVMMIEHWLISNDEMGGKVQHKDQKRMKAIISADTITERRPYARYSQTEKRLAAWGGTSNEQEIINDHTGNTRMVPIEVISIDFDALKKVDRDMLFVEAYHLMMDGFKSHMEPWELHWLQRISDEFTEVPLEVELIESLYNPCSFDDTNCIKLSASEIMMEINQDAGATLINKITMIGRHLKAMGFEQRRIKEEGKVTRMWAVKRARPVKNTGGNYHVRW